MKRVRKDKVLAVLTIYGAGEMTDAGRRHIARWLFECEKHLVGEGMNYSRRFRARYLVGAKP